MTTSEEGTASWLSPTRAWRLTECAASVKAIPAAEITARRVTANAGTVAHRAVQLWIEAQEYRHGDARAQLGAAIDAALASYGGTPDGEWAVTRARLLARSDQLAALLLSGDSVHSERELRDPGRAMRGTPDIVIIQNRDAVVVDLKTPTSKDELIPPWIEFQLTIYAHLVEVNYGMLPGRVEVFRLNRGLTAVPVSRAAVSDALMLVETARQADKSVATPGSETCRYCPRRTVCEPHWLAAATWSDPDCIEGGIETIERAANGLSAILIHSRDGRHWVTGIPGELLTAEEGAQIRMVRLRRTEQDGNTWKFSWSRYSALAFPQ